MGGTVRKGEKGHTVVFYKSLPVGDADADDDDRSSRSVWLKRAFTVFNLDQIDGVERPQVPVRTWESGEASARWEALFASYLANTGVRLERGGDRAFYVPATDVIVLPTTFKSEAGYVSTATHEAAHSTGHPSRLNRFRKQEYDGRVLDAREAYAQEELVAELASCFLVPSLAFRRSWNNTRRTSTAGCQHCVVTRTSSFVLQHRRARHTSSFWTEGSLFRCLTQPEQMAALGRLSYYQNSWLIAGDCRLVVITTLLHTQHPRLGVSGVQE